MGHPRGRCFFVVCVHLDANIHFHGAVVMITHHCHDCCSYPAYSALSLVHVHSNTPISCRDHHFATISGTPDAVTTEYLEHLLEGNSTACRCLGTGQGRRSICSGLPGHAGKFMSSRTTANKQIANIYRQQLTITLCANHCGSSYSPRQERPKQTQQTRRAVAEESSENL